MAKRGMKKSDSTRVKIMKRFLLLGFGFNIFLWFLAYRRGWIDDTQLPFKYHSYIGEYIQRNIDMQVEDRIYRHLQKELNRHPMYATVTDRVYLDVCIERKGILGSKKVERGRIVIGLFGDIKSGLPMTCRNFVALCDGKIVSQNISLSLKGSSIHRIIPGIMMQGGDITGGNGDGSMSIYGPTFKDEKIFYRHSEAGVVSMANCGPDTNGSQFFITLGKAHFLDDHHVVFGRVLEGMDFLKSVEKCGTPNGNVTCKVTIEGCGIMELPKNGRLSYPPHSRKELEEALEETIGLIERATDRMGILTARANKRLVEEELAEYYFTD